MSKRIAHIALTLLLSALVLAWAVVPPAIRHAHVGGRERDHRHGAFAEHEREHGENHEHVGVNHRHGDEDGRVASTAAIRGFLVHVHWALFGVDFSMPAPEDGGRNDNGRASKPALIRVVNELPTIALRVDRAGTAALVASPGPGPNLVPRATAPSHPPNATSSIPLCDSARRERSGVLLA